MFTSLDPRHSIKARVGYSFMLLVFLLIAILGYFIDRESQRQIEEDRGSALSQTAFQTVDKLDRGLVARFSNMHILASLEVIRDPNVPRDEKRLPLDELKNGFVYYRWAGLVDVNGQVLVATDHQLEGQDVSQEEWFINGKQGDTLQNPRKLTLTDAPAEEFLTLAVPVYDLNDIFPGNGRTMSNKIY
jgi:hypothetical protein